MMENQSERKLEHEMEIGNKGVVKRSKLEVTSHPLRTPTNIERQVYFWMGLSPTPHRT